MVIQSDCPHFYPTLYLATMLKCGDTYNQEF